MHSSARRYTGRAQVGDHERSYANTLFALNQCQIENPPSTGSVIPVT